MAQSRYYSSVAVQTTLTVGIGTGDTSMSVASTTGFPTNYPYVLALDFGGTTEELVLVTSAVGLTLSITRGFNGTSAQNHGFNATVRHVACAADFTDSRIHEAATSAVHGVTGVLVGTTDSQTLSNKTLSGVTLTGTMSGSGSIGISGAISTSSNISTTGTGTISSAASLSAATGISGQSLALSGNANGTIPVSANTLAGQTANLLQLAVNGTNEFVVANDGNITAGPQIQTWTPVITASSGFSLGNGTVAGRYIQIGKLATCWFTFTPGSTTNFGTGNWNITLPVNRANANSIGGNVYMDPSGSSGAVPGWVRFGADASHFQILVAGRASDNSATSGGLVDTATPRTWTSNGILYAMFTYETV